mmetsp:Transcript_25305/g.37810  ORF Transcript_25305/g.37810 Transcript_25305/m.37810 type:complete len:121 (-) Transcript_25305:225-587(-)
MVEHSMNMKTKMQLMHQKYFPAFHILLLFLDLFYDMVQWIATNIQCHLQQFSFFFFFFLFFFSFSLSSSSSKNGEENGGSMDRFFACKRVASSCCNSEANISDACNFNEEPPFCCTLLLE